MTPEPRTQGLEEVRAAPNDLTGQVVPNVNTAGTTVRNPEAHHSVFVAIPLQQGQDVVARCNGKWRDAVVVRPQRRKGRVGVVDTETWTEHLVTLSDVAIRASLAHALRRTPKANAAGAARAAAMRAKVAMIAAAAKARASAAAAIAAAATNNAPAPAVPDKPSPAAPMAVDSGRAPSPSAPTLVLERNLCRPDEAGLDRSVMEKTDEALHAKVLKGELPGVVNVVYRRGMLAHFDCFGYADLERKTPMRADSIVRLYSMTKSVVSVGVAILMEEGLVQLEDPVAKYIPSFAHVQVKLEDGTLEPIDKPITLLHLLTHTSGLGSGPMLGSDADGDAEERFVPLIHRSTLGRTDPNHPDAIVSLAHWCDELAKVPLLSHPGTEWYYSYSHDVVGRVLEVVSGKRLDVFLQERILGPLGMADTSFEVPPEKWDRVAGMYRRFEVEVEEAPATEGEAKEAAPAAEGTGNETSEAADGGESEKEAPPATYELRRLDSPSVETNEWVTGNLNPIFSGGGSVDALSGGLVSTAADYARFCLMLLRKGEIDGVRLLRPETVALITSNLLPRATGRDDVWAFGNAGMGFGLIGAVSVPHPDLDPALRPPEYGWGGMAGTAWTNDPREDFFLLSFSLTAFDLTTEEELRAGVRAAIASHNAAQGPAEPRRRRTSKRPESQTSPAAVPAAKRPALAASPAVASPSPSGAGADSAEKAGKRPRAATPKKKEQEGSPPKRRAAVRREELQRQATPLRPRRSEEAAEPQQPASRRRSDPKAKPQPRRAQSVPPPPRERVEGSADQAVGNPQLGAAHGSAPPQSPARRRASVGGSSRGGDDATPASAASPAAGSSTPRGRRVRARLTGSPAPRACAVNA